MASPRVPQQPNQWTLKSCRKQNCIHYKLLLLCLALMAFGYTMSNGVSWWATLPLDECNQTGEVHRPRTYHVHSDNTIPIATTTTRTTTSTTTPTTTTTTTTTTTPNATTTAAVPNFQFHQAYAPNYRFIINHPNACKDTPFLVLMVPVAPKNLEARNTIRQTWGKESLVQGQVVLTMFLLGLAGGPGADPQSLAQEDLQHGDIIQSNFLDSYNNLTIKTMVIMHWLATHCTNATFAMKVDSDMFLNIDNLVDMLKKPGIPRVNYLTGQIMSNRPVIRSKGSKWYVSKEMYPDPYYPVYALGMGYIFSIDLPARFVEISKTIKPFNIEDAYIGMCMKKLGLVPTVAPKPWQFKNYNSKYERCEFSRVITYILGSSKKLLEYWADLKKPGPACEQRTR